MILLKNSFSRRYPTARSVSLHRVRLRAVLDTFGFFRNSLTLRGVEFFELKIRICLRKQIFKKNHFSLFIRSLDGFDSWQKIAKVSWHCPFTGALIITELYLTKFFFQFFLLFSPKGIFLIWYTYVGHFIKSFY